MGNKINTPINYTGTSNSSGEILFDLLLAFIGINAGFVVGKNSPTRPTLFLTHSTDFNYFFNIPIRTYGFKEKLAKYDVTGLTKRINVEVELEVETGVVNSNKTLVDAYTKIENNDQLHGRWHSFFTANFDYTNVLTKSGNDLTIDTDWTLVIDKTSTSVFSVNKTSKVITIKASTYTGSLKTSGTGTVILKNGAIITGGTYNHVVLESGFTGSITLTSVKITTLENKTGSDLQLTFAGTSVATYQASRNQRKTILY